MRQFDREKLIRERCDKEQLVKIVSKLTEILEIDLPSCVKDYWGVLNEVQFESAHNAIDAKKGRLLRKALKGILS